MLVFANCRIGADSIEIIPIDKAVKVEATSNIDKLVVVYNSSEKSAGNDVSIIYNTLNKVIKRAGHIALVVTDAYDDNTKILGLLLAKNRVFNLFVCEDLLDVDEDYLEAISGSDVSQEELAQFVGKDIAAYASTREIVRNLSSSVNKSDSTIASMVRESKDNISGIANIFELMQSFIDNNCAAIAMGGSVSGVDAGLAQRNIKEIQRLNGMVEDLNREKVQLQIKLDRAEKSVRELEAYKENAQVTMNNNPLSDKYVTLDVNKFVNIVAPGRRKPIIKDILYFKEISACRFINSFIIKLIKYMVQQLGIKCKLVIYDRKSFSNFKYGNLKVLDGGEYERLKRSTELGDAFVVTEAARNIIEDLITENEVLIIYDRLGADNNIVSGRSVHEYYVLNGLKEYIELTKTRQVDKNTVITNFGVDKHMISIADIFEYKMMSDGGKFSAYVNMPSTIDVTKSNYEIIFTDCGMIKWIEGKR